MKRRDQIWRLWQGWNPCSRGQRSGTRRRIRQIASFRLDAGDGEDRQILSGIAKFYPNEQELVGKKLQIVANLKPRKMMKKYVSQGMILSAEYGDQLTVLTVDPSVPNGSIIG